ncbi:MAG: hydantoinase B/oxoprolinase family protein [Thermoplasmataceae archaeon]|jgi:N-methylhydantoinase B
MIKDWELIGKTSQFIAEEMGISLKRSAISPNIRERMDHSCAILDRSGRIAAQAEHIPVHLGSFKIGSMNLLKWVRSNRTELSEGDMMLTNDPYITGTHLNDVMLMAPVYHEELICAYVVNKAHIVDVGGPVFGSLNPNAKNLFQEGMIIPPVKLVKNGKIDSEILSIILSNFKEPSTALGDINAQIAANRAGIGRIMEMMDEYGTKSVLHGWKEAMKHSRKLALSGISGWKQGSFYATDTLEAGNSSILLKLRLDISNDSITADFSGSSSDLELPLNAVKGVTFSAVAYAVRSAMNSEIPTNDGLYSILKVNAPEGSLLNPERPLPVSGGNVETTQRIADVVHHALSESAGTEIPSASSGTMFNVMMGGPRGEGKFWSYYETIGGGNGAGKGRNGESGVHSNMTNTMNTPVEVAEREYPIFFTSYKIRKNSGGTGAWKGGDGIIRSFIANEACTISVLADRFVNPPYALAGGKSGKTGMVYITHEGKKRRYPSKFTADLAPGDEVIIFTPGGSGYGKKRKTNPDRGANKKSKADNDM